MTDTTVNPLYEFRVNGNKDPISISELARIIGVTESTIIRTEQGLYNEIPPAILRYLATFAILPSSISAQYRRYQIDKRHRTGARLKRIKDATFRGLFTSKDRNTNPASDVNPAIVFRQDILGYRSRLAFCKDFCLHPSTVKRFEDGLSTSVPSSILSALDDAGISSNIQGLLEFKYTAWRQRKYQRINNIVDSL